MAKKVFIKEEASIARIAAKLLRSRQMALVIGNTIYLHNTPVAEFKDGKRWVAHELKHVQQYEENGLFKFLIRYTWYSILHGYVNNPYEIEARKAENDVSLLQQYELVKR